jgi:hypothetical protein
MQPMLGRLVPEGGRVTVEFIFNDRPVSERNYWLIVEPGSEVDLCVVDPGFDVDLYVSTDLRTMTEIWLGYTAIGAACEKGRFVLTGTAGSRPVCARG